MIFNSLLFFLLLTLPLNLVPLRPREERFWIFFFKSDWTPAMMRNSHWNSLRTEGKILQHSKFPRIWSFTSNEHPSLKGSLPKPEGWWALIQNAFCRLRTLSTLHGRVPADDVKAYLILWAQHFLEKSWDHENHILNVWIGSIFYFLILGPRLLTEEFHCFRSCFLLFDGNVFVLGKTAAFTCTYVCFREGDDRTNLSEKF